MGEKPVVEEVALRATNNNCEKCYHVKFLILDEKSMCHRSFIAILKLNNQKAQSLANRSRTIRIRIMKKD
jgi:hypothetical protein